MNTTTATTSDPAWKAWDIEIDKYCNDTFIAKLKNESLSDIATQIAKKTMLSVQTSPSNFTSVTIKYKGTDFKETRGKYSEYTITVTFIKGRRTNDPLVYDNDNLVVTMVNRYNRRKEEVI